MLTYNDFAALADLQPEGTRFQATPIGGAASELFVARPPHIPVFDIEMKPLNKW